MGVPKAVDFWVDYFSLIVTGLAKGLVSKDDIEAADVSFVNDEGENVQEHAYRARTDISGKEFMNWVLKVGGYSDLNGLFNDPRFKQFPLYNPTLSVTLLFVPKEILKLERNIDIDSPDFVEAHHSFDSTQKSLSKVGKNQIFVNQGFGFQIYLPVEQLENLNTELLRKQIKSVISHELTHAYETYHRVKTSGDPYQGRESFLNAAVKLMSDEKYPQWRDFLHLVYLHLGFEINARVTQLYYEVRDKDIETTDQFLEAVKRSTVWREVKMLEDFNADEFIKSFKKANLGLGDMIKDLGKQLERKTQGLPAIYNIKDPKKGMQHLIQGWDYILQKLNHDLTKMGVYKGKLMDFVPQKAMDDPYHFFKFFEERFHRKAQKFKRKIYRIGSLAMDKSIMQ